jgi:glycosyltransferase involved in cell wall biosynthesis
MAYTAASDAPAGRPRVTIIIPCFNAELYLAEALSSAVGQTYENVEIVLVDDGSTDRSAEIARGFPQVRVVSQRNAGSSAARNTGLGVSESEFVLFLDADDRLAADAVQNHLEGFAQRPDVAMVYGGVRIIDRFGNVLEQLPWEVKTTPWRDLLVLLAPVPTQSMFRRDRLVAAGRFDPKVGLAQDFELLTRLARTSDLYCHGRLVADYRRHPAQATLRVADSLLSMLGIIDRFLLTVEDKAEAAALRKRAYARWITFYGQYMPYEVVRLLRAGEWTRAAGTIRTFIRFLPRTGVAASQEIGGRIVRLVMQGRA